MSLLTRLWALVVARFGRQAEPAALCPACLIDLVSNPGVVYWPRDGYMVLDCPCGESSKWDFDAPRAEGDPAVPLCVARWRTYPKVVRGSTVNVKRPHVLGAHGKPPTVNGKESLTELRMCDAGCGRVVPVGSVRWHTGHWFCDACKLATAQVQENARLVH